MNLVHHMSVYAPLTCLGGTLVRDLDCAEWRWSDGVPAPAVRDLTIQDCAPSFRCSHNTHVEIPQRWRSPARWPRGVVDDDAAAAIQRLIDTHGRSARIFAEGLAELRDDHRLTREGWIVPTDAWDAVMSQPCGATWDASYEVGVLNRAYALGWRPPAGWRSAHGWGAPDTAEVRS